MSNQYELKKSIFISGASADAVLLITAVHHMYGAAVYNTPWRNHVVMPAAITAMAIIATLYLYYKRPYSFGGQSALWLGSAITLIVPFGLFGMFEGGYNHVFKNIVYFSGASASLLQKLFPPPTYELPNNLFFELTGILTFFAALPLPFNTYRLIRNRRVNSDNSGGHLTNAVM